LFKAGVIVNMAQPSTCLFLQCQTQLPGRLDLVREGYFVRNDHDYSYTSKQYQQIRVVPNSLADGYIWTFSVEAGALNEKLCATIHFSSGCNGWLATECGPCALQEWKTGGYPWSACVPMRFIDASVKLTPQKPITDMIQQLTQSVINLREDYKKDRECHEGTFKAICQRHETAVTNVLQHSATILAETRAMTEEHVQEALRIGNAISEERSKMHAAEIKARLDQFQTSMEGDATYRDTLHTEFQLATEARLQDSEARVSEKQEKHRQEIAEMQEENVCLMQDQLAKSSKIEAHVQDLDGKVMHIEVNMKEMIIQTILELIQQRRTLQLEDETGMQLAYAPQLASVVDEDTIQDDTEGNVDGDDLKSVVDEGATADEGASERKGEVKTMDKGDDEVEEAAQRDNGTVVQTVNAPHEEMAVDANATQELSEGDWSVDEWKLDVKEGAVADDMATERNQRMKPVDEGGDAVEDIAPERRVRTPFPSRGRSLTPLRRRITLRSRSRKHRSHRDVGRSRRDRR